MFQTSPALRDAYADAALVLADGAPVVWASRLLGRRLPERVAGSDLAPALFKRANAEERNACAVFLLGAAPGVAERAAANIVQRWPKIEIVGTLSPPLGFEKNPAENQKIFAAIAAAQPDLLLLGLGAPKQELWIHEHADRVAGEGRPLHRRHDRLSGRREESRAALDAAGRARMDPPSLERAGATRQAVPPRRLDLSAAGLARLAAPRDDRRLTLLHWRACRIATPL